MRSRALFTIITILALLLLVTAAFLTRVLFGLSVPDARPTTVVDHAGPRDSGPAVSESMIDVTGTQSVPPGTMMADTGLTTTAEGLISGGGISGAGPLHPAICRGYGDEVTSRRRYGHPVGYQADFRSDGVRFRLFPDHSIEAPRAAEEEAEEEGEQQ